MIEHLILRKFVSNGSDLMIKKSTDCSYFLSSNDVFVACIDEISKRTFIAFNYAMGKRAQVKYSVTEVQELIEQYESKVQNQLHNKDEQSSKHSEEVKEN